MKPIVAGTPAVGQPVEPPSKAPVPVAKPQVVKTIRRVGNAFSPSIKDALAGNIPAKSAEDTQKTIFSQYPIGQSEPFTQEQLTVKWNEFLETINDRPSLRSALSVVPDIDEGNKLILKVGNSVQEGDIRLIKMELVSWLRSELKNSEIELITKLDKIETERMIFSDSEKLQMMLTKNPELFVLKQKFNLDFSD